jgi:hypothetical protein
LGHLEDLAERYQDRAIFRFVYVSEAHGLEELGNDDVCSIAQEYDSPWVSLRDTKDKKAETAYNAWPKRLVILQNGRVAFDEGRGMIPGWDFDAIEEHLKSCLTPPENERDTKPTGPRASADDGKKTLQSRLSGS